MIWRTGCQNPQKNASRLLIISEGSGMEAQQDFKELLELFNEHHVEYMIVGGYALAFHGAPRYTGDMDIYINPEHKNAERVMEALEEFGFGSFGLRTEDFMHQEKIIQLGVPPVRIDIITSITGVSWQDASSGKVKGQYGDIEVYYIGRDQFISNKKAAGRRRDIADLELLGAE
jgi:hypothetical protein